MSEYRELGTDFDEDLLGQCLEVIRKEQKASVWLLQRRLRLGYTRAARIMDELEKRGIVGPHKSHGEPRDILIDLDQSDNKQLDGQTGIPAAVELWRESCTVSQEAAPDATQGPLSLEELSRAEDGLRKRMHTIGDENALRMIAMIRQLLKKVEAQEMHWRQFYGNEDDLRKGALAIMHLRDRAEKAEKRIEELEMSKSAAEAERDHWKRIAENNQCTTFVSGQIEKGPNE